MTEPDLRRPVCPYCSHTSVARLYLASVQLDACECGECGDDASHDSPLGPVGSGHRDDPPSGVDAAQRPEHDTVAGAGGEPRQQGEADAGTDERLDDAVVADAVHDPHGTTGDALFAVKIGYDESLRQGTPGVLLLADLATWFHEHTDADLLDSCAVPDHALINRLWPDRRDLTTLVLPARGPLGRAAKAFDTRGRARRDDA